MRQQRHGHGAVALGRDRLSKAWSPAARRGCEHIAQSEKNLNTFDYQNGTPARMNVRISAQKN
jgi:hypothetical protein